MFYEVPIIIQLKSTKQPASIRYGVLNTLCWRRAYPYLTRLLLYVVARTSCLFRGLCPILCRFVCKRLLAWSLTSEALIWGLIGLCASLEVDLWPLRSFIVWPLASVFFVSVFGHGIEHHKDWTCGPSWGRNFLAKYRLHWLYPSIITLLNHFWLMDGACNVWTDPRVSKKQ